MSQFIAKVKTSFTLKGIKIDKGMSVELVSKQSSVPNLLSAGKQDIIDAFQRKFGITIDQIYVSNNYLDVTKVS